MKVNFWQVLGLLIIVVGVIFAFRQKTAKNDIVTPPATNEVAPVATQPAS